VTFDLNHEGAATSTKVEVAAGGKVSAPTPPTRDAHSFGGWYTDAACEAPFDFENTEVAGDLTLYAKWTEAAAGAYRLAAEWVRDSAARCLAVDSEGNVYTGGRNGITSYDAAGNERAAFNASAHYVNIGYGLPTNERIGIVRIGDKEYLAAIEPSGMGSRLYILDTDSGALFWQAQTPSAEIQSLPAVDGASGNIYAVVTETGTRWLYAFNIDAESYLWKARIGSAASSDFALFALWGDRIFFEIGHEIWGFKSDGTQLWYRNGTSPSAKFQADHSLLVNPQDGTIYWGAPNYRLQALDPDTGTTKWHVSSSTTANPVFTPDGRAILANINDRLRKIDPATGTLDEIVNGEPMGLYAAFDGDGWLYTATNIYNDSLEVVASYAQTGEAARLPGFALHVKGGAMYRLVGTVAFSVTHVEKVKPVSGADATVATLGLNAAAPVEIPLGAHVTIEALARNADGISLPGADLEWSSSDAGIAAVTAAAAGAATVEAKALGSAEIRVKAKGTELTASVAVTVTDAPVPTRMYLSYKNGMTTARPPAIERIDGYVREAIPHIYLVVEDQYGDYYDSLPVSWEIPDLGFATYQDGSSAYAIKYGALVKAPDPTESYIKVTAQSNPNLFCQIPVSIKPQRAKTLWSFKPNPTDFSNPEWEYTSFAVNEDGSVAYLVDTGVLYALDLSTGNRLWELSLRVEGTEKPSRPKLGADGNIYLSEVGARKMYKVGPDGTLLAQSAWSAPITDFLMDGSYAYVLTAAGGINRVNDKLERLWAQDTLLAGAELYGEAELRGAYVYGENLYAASGDKLYKIHRDGACEVLFEDKNTSLRLDGVDSNGNLLLQRISATQTGLLFLNLYGEKLWSYNRSAAERSPAYQPVTAIIDDTVWSAEVVFDARGDSTSDKRVYSFGADGQPSMDVVFTDSGTMPPKHIAVGPDGLIYVGTMQLNALTADGALLWQYPTDPSIAFDLYAEPTQMLSTRPGTLVVAFGGPVVSSGMIVVQAIAQDALGISLRGDALAADGALSAAAGAFSDLRLTLTDYAEAPVDATIELRLTDAATGALLSRIAYEERLVNGAAYDYALGARIPEASGDFVLYVTVTDKDQGLLCSEEIPVRLR
jgi:uncharacterized repeat protein (TIGR02543 family)